MDGLMSDHGQWICLSDGFKSRHTTIEAAHILFRFCLLPSRHHSEPFVW